MCLVCIHYKYKAPFTRLPSRRKPATRLSPGPYASRPPPRAPRASGRARRRRRRWRENPSASVRLLRKVFAPDRELARRDELAARPSPRPARAQAPTSRVPAEVSAPRLQAWAAGVAMGRGMAPLAGGAMGVSSMDFGAGLWKAAQGGQAAAGRRRRSLEELAEGLVLLRTHLLPPAARVESTSSDTRFQRSIFPQVERFAHIKNRSFDLHRLWRGHEQNSLDHICAMEFNFMCASQIHQ